MSFADTKFHKTFKKYEKFIMAVEGLCIMLMLIGLWVYFYNDYNIKREINENCGWGEDDYYCFCEKSEAMEIKNKIESGQTGEVNLFGLGNASLGG